MLASISSLLHLKEINNVKNKLAKLLHGQNLNERQKLIDLSLQKRVALFIRDKKKKKTAMHRNFIQLLSFRYKFDNTTFEILMSNKSLDKN